MIIFILIIVFAFLTILILAASDNNTPPEQKSYTKHKSNKKLKIDRYESLQLSRQFSITASDESGMGVDIQVSDVYYDHVDNDIILYGLNRYTNKNKKLLLSRTGVATIDKKDKKSTYSFLKDENIIENIYLEKYSKSHRVVTVDRYTNFYRVPPADEIDEDYVPYNQGLKYNGKHFTIIFDYFNYRQHELYERTVDIKLVYTDSEDDERHYFKGFCHLRNEDRTFRLDRMQNIRTIDNISLTKNELFQLVFK